MFSTLLIANRGEIAVRIIRACRELGVSPIAVYSEADAGALHVALADSAYCIGPAPAPESYLNIERVLEAARSSGAEAVHPGYGFLSENAEFATACAAAGITFVGPPPEAMRLLGDKSEAKRLVSRVGVPVTPGYLGEDQSDARLAKEAEAIGLPVLIKAVAGGGGRGMRVVRDMATFTTLLAEARREAKGARGDDRVMLERYVERPRHVEIQVFGDRAGNVVHLGERECSIQRRHQKIIEESPSVALDPALRARMAEAAVRAAQAAGYVNAGTVEFLLERRPGEEPAFYFLEVNARLQVEHPVTELVTGLDLVRAQLAVASGEPLPFAQEQIGQRGHAIEARINAEEPGSGLPSVGKISQWIEPIGPGIRVDSGFGRGSEVTPFYDSLVAKLIVYAADRAAAIDRLEQALLRFAVLGVRTNIPYLLAIIRDPAFRAGDTHTGFLADRFAGWRPDTAVPEEVLLALAGEAVTRADVAANIGAVAPSAARDVWKRPGSWRNV